ncbi:MAG: hypothetical protein WC081_07000 [Candidatus Ratteibacteria bacterium]|jgi:hypothetical protein
MGELGANAKVLMLLTLGSLLLAGCVTFGSESDTNSPTSEQKVLSGAQTCSAVFEELIPEHKPDFQTFKESYEKSWSVTVGVLKTLENPITSADKENGVIVTDYLEKPKGMFKGPWRDKYYVTVSKTDASTTQIKIKRTVEELEALERVQGSRLVGKVWREKTGGVEWMKKQSNGAYEKYILGLIGKNLK